MSPSCSNQKTSSHQNSNPHIIHTFLDIEQLVLLDTSADLRRRTRFLIHEFRQKIYLHQWAASVTFFAKNTHDMSRNAKIPYGQSKQLFVVSAFV